MLKQAHKISKRISSITARFIRDESGGMITLTAFMLPMIFGFAGMGIDVTSWYMERRLLQNMADMGALEGAHSSDYNQGDALTLIVKNLLENEGYDAATDTVTVSYPPVSGTYAGNNGYVEVNASRQVNLYVLSGFYALRGENVTVDVSARAVAGDVVTGEQCIVALSETADAALSFQGTADVDAACGVASNSTSATAIDIAGTANLTASPAQAVGDINVGGSATLTTASPIQTFAPKVDDPYDQLQISTKYPNCTYSGGGSPNDVTNFGTLLMINDPNGNGDVPDVDADGKQYLELSPGRYCGGLKLQSNQYHIVLGTDASGTGEFIIDGGDISASAQTTVSGSEITIFLTASSGIASDIGTINKFNGGATMNLSAPTDDTNDYHGILFFQDPDATGGTAWFNGGATMNFDGALYFPSTEINFTGGSSSTPTCMQIIGDTVSFTGSSVIGNDPTICQSLGLDGTFAMIRVELVE